MRWRLAIAFAVSPLVPVAIVVARDPLSAVYILLPIVGSYVHALIGGAGYLWLRDRNRLSTVNILLLSVVTGLIPIGFVTLVGGISAAVSGEKVTALILLDQARIILDAAGLGLAAGVCWRLLAGDPRRYQSPLAGRANSAQ
jgi:hypothetical protein